MKAKSAFHNQISIISKQHIHLTTSLCNSVKQSPLYLLRSKTGLAYNLCREALDKHDNNVDQAAAWLEAQALALGLQKATKVRDRSAREGLIGMSISEDNKLISIMELNCETDFVAKNQMFKDFAFSIIDQLGSTRDSSSKDDRITKQLLASGSQDCIEILSPSKADLENIDAQIPPLISKLGENIKVNRANHFRIRSENVEDFLFGQIHAQIVSPKETKNGLLSVGRYGAMVALRRQNQQKSLEQLKQFGNRLCHHVIGFNPTYIELPDEIRKQLENLEKQKQEELSKREELDSIEEQEESSSDSDENEATSQVSSRDDWPSIMDQTLIMSEDGLNVRDFCKQQELEMLFFNRIECGNQET